MRVILEEKELRFLKRLVNKEIKAYQNQDNFSKKSSFGLKTLETMVSCKEKLSNPKAHR